MGYFGFRRKEKRKERVFGEWAYGVETGIHWAIEEKHSEAGRASYKYRIVLAVLEKYQTNLAMNFYCDIDKHTPQLKNIIDEKIQSDEKKFYRNADISLIAYVISLFCIACLIRTKKEISEKNVKELIKCLDLDNHERDKMYEEFLYSYELQKKGIAGDTPKKLPWEKMLKALCGFDDAKKLKAENDSIMELTAQNAFIDGMGRFTLETIDAIIREYDDRNSRDLGSIFELD